MLYTCVELSAVIHCVQCSFAPVQSVQCFLIFVYLTCTELFSLTVCLMNSYLVIL